MLNKEDLVKSGLYFLLVVIGELVLHFSMSYFSTINKFTMPVVLVLFSLIAWLLKCNLATLIIVACLLVLYGCVAFYSGYNAYSPDFPNTIVEFFPTILVKTLIYTFPIVLISVIGFKK